jgi:hypothetical protein
VLLSVAVLPTVLQLQPLPLVRRVVRRDLVDATDELALDLTLGSARPIEVLLRLQLKQDFSLPALVGDGQLFLKLEAALGRAGDWAGAGGAGAGA